MAPRRFAEVFPPGEFLRDELEERGWSQSDLAQIMGRPTGMIAQIVNGKRMVTPETARDLAAAFDTTPEFWLNLESAYQLSRLKNDDSDTIAKRAKLFEKAPVKDMIRRGWIEPSDNIAVLEGRVLKFFNIKSLDAEPQIPRHAARKSSAYDQPLTTGQRAWLFRAYQLARGVHAEAFSENSVEAVTNRLRQIMHAPQELRHVPRILSDAGIRYVIVQPLPGSKIDGACFWLDSSPVVAMTLRHDRLDNFWFVLLHELGHVAQGITSLDNDLDASSNDSERPATEREADEFATTRLIAPKQLESFIARVQPLYSARRIEAFAQILQIHPAIVVGQLQHRREVAFSSFRKLLTPVRDIVIDSALTDGWGATLPFDL
ncbi:MAG TPA: HigA family addiction module antitoxin [Thermomicrobiales bacterium]|jgi:HTH-type transcriptional regulator/antitoxin HigA